MSPSAPARGHLQRPLGSSLALMLFAGSTPAGSLAVSVIAARVLGASSFGAFALIWATVQTFSSVGQLSLAFTATRFAAQLALRDPAGAVAAIWKCLQWSAAGGLLIFLALFFGADLIAASMLGHAELAGSLRVAAMVAAFMICSAVLGAGLVGLPSTTIVTTLGALQLLLPVSCAAVGALVGGLVGTLVGLACAQAIRLLVGVILLRNWSRQHAQGPAHDAVGGKDLLNFAAPNVIAGLITPSAQWLSLAAVGSTASGLVAAAMFAVANNLRNAVAFSYTVLSQLFSVRVNQAVGAGEYSAASKMVGLNLKLSVAAAAVLSVVVLLSGDLALQVFGSDYSHAMPALRFLLIAAVLDAASSAVYQYVIVAGSMWKSLLFIVLPRESCLLAITLLSAPSPTEISLASAHAVAALIGLMTTTAVARDGWLLLASRRARA